MNKNYVEWGHYRGKRKKKNFIVYGSDAYDLWHLAVRFKEVINTRNLKKRKKINFDLIPRKEKFLILFLFFALKKPKNIIELGCSAMEIIDGLELIRKFYLKKINTPRISKINFSGIDTSNLFRSCSKIIHTSNEPTIYKTANEFIKKTKSFSKTMLHDLGVSNYAFHKSKNFIKFLNHFDSAYFRLTLSTDKTFSINPRGKKLTFFSINDMKKLKKPLYILFYDNKIRNWTILKDDKNLKKRTITCYFFFGNLYGLDSVKSKLNASSIFKKINFNPVRIN